MWRCAGGVSRAHAHAYINLSFVTDLVTLDHVEARAVVSVITHSGARAGAPQRVSSAHG